MLWTCLILALATAAGIGFISVGLSDNGISALFMAIVGTFTFLAAMLLGPAIVDGPWISSLLPVNYRELAQLEWKLAWPMVVCFAGPVLLYCCGVAYLFDYDPQTAVWVGVKFVAFVLAGFPTVTIICFSAYSDDNKSPFHRQLLLLAIVVGALIVTLASTSAIFVHGWWSAGILGFLAVTTRVARWLQSKAWARCWFEVKYNRGMAVGRQLS
jgi:hypothetical protein